MTSDHSEPPTKLRSWSYLQSQSPRLDASAPAPTQAMQIQRQARGRDMGRDGEDLGCSPRKARITLHLRTGSTLKATVRVASLDCDLRGFAVSAQRTAMRYIDVASVIESLIDAVRGA